MQSIVQNVVCWRVSLESGQRGQPVFGLSGQTGRCIKSNLTSNSVWHTLANAEAAFRGAMMKCYYLAWCLLKMRRQLKDELDT